MRSVSLLILPLLWLGAAAPAVADDAALGKLVGTYTQNVKCKGGGKDDPKKLVKVSEAQVDSNFGPCVMSDKKWDGNTFKANASCKPKSGDDLDIQIALTPKDENTIDFLEESSQYKSVLYRCPEK
jgi:hypothetical protein